MDISGWRELFQILDNKNVSGSEFAFRIIDRILYSNAGNGFRKSQTVTFLSTPSL
jgi:hypothetical protein